RAADAAGGEVHGDRSVRASRADHGDVYDTTRHIFLHRIERAAQGQDTGAGIDHRQRERVGLPQVAALHRRRGIRVNNVGGHHTIGIDSPSGPLSTLHDTEDTATEM